jgi:uncharacterized protein (TIGR01777 family)
MKKILIAGGSGLVGTYMMDYLRKAGYSVSILSRNPTKSGEYFWNPKTKEIDVSILHDIEVLINLSGAGVADQKWTSERKHELQESRVGTNLFLRELAPNMPKLEHFICASGINAFGFNDEQKVYVEQDDYGSDFLSQLVKVWELSADRFADICPVTKLRIGVVLSNKGGALSKMLPAVKMGMGSPIGSGQQMVPWIHIHDLARAFEHVIAHRITGCVHTIAGQVPNKILMKDIATVLKKPFWAPNVPAFVLRLMYGEMSLILLKGVSASNEHLIKSGFTFSFPNIQEALADLLLES